MAVQYVPPNLADDSGRTDRRHYNPSDHHLQTRLAAISHERRRDDLGPLAVVLCLADLYSLLPILWARKNRNKLGIANVKIENLAIGFHIRGYCAFSYLLYFPNLLGDYHFI